MPLFGYGIALAILAIAFLGWLIWTVVKKQPTAELVGTLPVWLIAGAIAIFVLPAIEVTTPAGEAIGLPIRGYGVMVLLGLLAGIGISAYRGQQLGISSDTIIGLGFWMMLGGVIGARAFYVIQKWQEFDGATFVEKLGGVLKLTEGGLVIYGGVLGGMVAGALYCRKHKLWIPATADLVAPGFLIGLSLGRIGCLLHGCCFGGVCDAPLPTIQFPHGSVPFQAQLESGELLGIEFGQQGGLPARIEGVASGGPAEIVGLKPGDVVDQIRSLKLPPAEGASATAPPKIMSEVVVDGKVASIFPEQTPTWSLPVHPSQIYAAINALLLCIVIWHFQPVPDRDGVVFLVGILLYAISRFLLEGIRSDEEGQFGTPLSVAQIVGIGSGLAAIGGLLVVRSWPKGRVWSWGVE